MQDRRRGALTVILFAAVAVVVAALYGGPISVDRFGDLDGHVANAAAMSAKGELQNPHFLFHLTTLVTASVTGVALKPVAIALTTAAQGMTCFLLVLILRYGQQTLGLSRPLGTETAMLAGFALSFVGPLSLFSYPNLQVGYPGISIPYSPTIILLKPLALALFFVTLRLLASRSWSQWTRPATLAAVLAIVGGLAKPSYNVCLAPALALLLVLQFRREGSLSKISLATFALLAVWIGALTAWQIAFTYGPATNAGITVAPLKVLAHYNHGSYLLTVAKLGLGLAFPLFVAAAYRRSKSCASDAFRLSWLTTLMAIGSGYLLAETGPTELHGNLLWSMQVCLLILMTTSLAVFLSEEAGFRQGDPAPATWRAFAGTLLFLLHFFSGLMFVNPGALPF